MGKIRTPNYRVRGKESGKETSPEAKGERSRMGHQATNNYGGKAERGRFNEGRINGDEPRTPSLLNQ